MNTRPKTSWEKRAELAEEDRERFRAACEVMAIERLTSRNLLSETIAVLRDKTVYFWEGSQRFFCKSCRYNDPLDSVLHHPNCKFRDLEKRVDEFLESGKPSLKDDDEAPDYGDGEDEDEFDCHRGPDGSCGLAGTEEMRLGMSLQPAVKHTRGPWRTHVPTIPITKLAAEDRMVLARAFDGSEKAIVDRVRGGTPEEANANALLIAAAPDLLAALKNWQDFDLTLEQRQNAAMAAIAKAEGK